MAQQSTADYVRPARFFAASPLNGQEHVNSSNISTSAIGRLAAASLVVASAGFGALYAWQTGSEHGLAMAALAVVMALGLEAAKPLALMSAFEAIRAWRLASGAALTVLGLVAVAYSLTAELSLMAGARGDRVAERAAVSDTARNAKERRGRLEDELAALSNARPAAAVSAELGAILTDKRLANCDTWLASLKLRTKCIEKVAPLRAELAIAERRDTLRRELAQLADRPRVGELRPDPAAHALAVYLALLGIKLEAAVLTEWLALIPVLALEVGSAFAGILARGVATNTPSPTRSTPTPIPAPFSEQIRAENDVFKGVQDGPPVLTVPDAPAERLVQLLNDRGGEVLAGQRTLAKALGISAGGVNALLRELADAGRVVVEAGRGGTLVKLAA